MRRRSKSTAAWPYVTVLLPGLGLLGCSGLPGWIDGRTNDPTGAREAIVAFPDLSALPTPPGSPPSEDERNASVQSLETARTQNQQAGENLGSQIETSFEYPSSSDNRE